MHHVNEALSGPNVVLELCCDGKPVEGFSYTIDAGNKRDRKNIRSMLERERDNRNRMAKRGNRGTRTTEA